MLAWTWAAMSTQIASHTSCLPRCHRPSIIPLDKPLAVTVTEANELEDWRYLGADEGPADDAIEYCMSGYLAGDLDARETTVAELVNCITTRALIEVDCSCLQ